MADVELDGIIASLRSERERLREVVEGLKEGIREAERSLFRIEEAFAAFERKPSESIKENDAEKDKKENVWRVEVVSIIEEELKRKGVVDGELLKLYVEQEVERRGKSTLGLELSMRGALSDERFVDTPGGFRLKEEEEESIEEGKDEVIAAG